MPTTHALRLSLLAALGGLTLGGCQTDGTDLWNGGGQDQTPLAAATGLSGAYVSLASFSNPQPNIPAQCYIETSGGTQNACVYCHTNGLAEANPPLGNNNAQGDLQVAYSFAPGLSVNHWENTLFPEKLRAVAASLGVNPDAWDMQAYIRQDNWSEAYQARGAALAWNTGNGALRLFPALDPADLPARTDGFVRSNDPQHGYFHDGQGWNTGWRAINFMPYGIFTPMTGSVSGVYIRLPQRFMQRADGSYDLTVYQQNLDLLERAIQNRLAGDDPGHYYGAAADVAVRPGLYPLGTEFAHPLHYVDVAADGSDPAISRFPGTRAQRVKEIRYMYKWQDFDPTRAPAGGTEEEKEPGSVLVNAEQGWIDNGAGWVLAGYIENAAGRLRPQTAEELMQCFGCHSGQGQGGGFKSGVGNTVDSTWAFPRKFAGSLGWQEMNYLGYRHDPAAARSATPGIAGLGDPFNRGKGKGEFRYFLDTVVGASLYGDMPTPIEQYLSAHIRTANGYSADWPALDASDPERLLAAQRLRQQLMRELTARGEHLDGSRHIAGALLYPPQEAALAGAARYRQVVVTQRYTLGKDVFAATPFTYRYYRPARYAYTHADGRPYAQGEIITDRPVDAGGTGQVPTLIALATEAEGGTFNTDYQPFLAYPSRFEP